MTATAQQVLWAPQPGPQEALLACSIADVFYGGARGGGKTDGLLGDWLRHRLRCGSAARGILFRRTYDEFEEIERRSLELYPSTGGGYNHTKRTWTWSDGSSLRLRYLDVDSDADHYQGHSYTWQGFDELPNWPSPEPVDKLWATLRSAQGVPCVRRSTGNPGGPGHHWVKGRYIKPGGRIVAPMTPFTYQPQPERRPDLRITAVFIPATLEDNVLLMEHDPGYEDRLAAAGNPTLFRAWREGDWDVVAGAVFEEWDPKVHVVNKFRIPTHWAFAAGMDWGYRAPGAFYLFAMAPEGDVLAFEEVYFKQQHGYAVGFDIGMVLRRYPVQVDYIAGDEQMWYQTGVSAPTIAEEVQGGLADAFGTKDIMRVPRLTEATHGRGSRRTKLALMHRYLSFKRDPTGQVQPWNRPLLRFTDNCVNAIRTIPALPYDTKAHHLEDVDTNAEDHAYDAVAAFLMSRPPTPEALVKPKPRDLHPGFEGKRRRRMDLDEPMARPTFEGIAYHVPRRDELQRAKETDR